MINKKNPLPLIIAIMIGDRGKILVLLSYSFLDVVSYFVARNFYFLSTYGTLTMIRVMTVHITAVIIAVFPCIHILWPFKGYDSIAKITCYLKFPFGNFSFLFNSHLAFLRVLFLQQRLYSNLIILYHILCNFSRESLFFIKIFIFLTTVFAIV